MIQSSFARKRKCKRNLNLLQYIMAKLDFKATPSKKQKIVSMWDGKEGFDFECTTQKNITKTSKGQLYKETYQYLSRGKP